MAENQTNIHIGSIIHLENGAERGGFLDGRGWVSDKPVITKWQDPRIRAFVFTHESPHRAEGSGSWRIVSVIGKQDGEPLLVGDKIHLLSLFPGAGYLDSFEWVSNLEPFKNYPMTIGVFTCSEPQRGGGLSGTWTVRSGTGKPDGAAIVEGDAIYLGNDYPGAGFLYSYGDVTSHPLFDDYTGHRKFVFTHPHLQEAGGSPRWTVRLSGGMNYWYRVQVQWGDEEAPWHDEGLFGLGHRAAHPVVALRLALTEGGRTLEGAVTYLDEESVSLRATHTDRNRYSISTDSQASPAEWRIGARDFQPVVGLELTSGDKGVTLTGVVTYAGESPVRFRGVRADDFGASGFGLAQADPVLGRAKRLEGVLSGTHRLLSDALREMANVSIGEAKKIVDTKERLLEQHATRGTAQSELAHFIDLDRDFQMRQLLNLHALSRRLNGYFRETLQPLIRVSMQTHQQQNTAAPLHLLRRCLQRVATDHEIIQRAAQQRRWNRHADGKFYVSEQALELLVMDRLAIKALAPCRNLLSNRPQQNPPVVLSYLSERTHIHHLPYTDDLILIGVSYDRVPPADSLFADKQLLGSDFPAAELLAIPHEVGHYIYHHARLDESGATFADLSEGFRDNPYFRWCEELFADLYGCVVAGPLSALSMQALLTSGDKARMWKDDEEHPTPLLRVFILAEMLRVLEKRQEERSKVDRNMTVPYAFPQLVGQLEQDWAEILRVWGYERVGEGVGRPNRIFLPDPAAVQLDKLVNVDRVVAAVRPILVAFAEALLSAADFDDRQPVEEGSLSLKIPWCRLDSRIPEDFHAQMAAVRQDARKRTPLQPVVEEKVSPSRFDGTYPDRLLHEILSAWDDSGPTGFGDNP